MEKSIRKGWKGFGQDEAEFQHSHGECRRPASTVPQNLVGERKNGQPSSLTAERTGALNNLGFDWVLGRGGGSENDTNWELRLEEFRVFRQIHGHCRVPSKYPKNPSLGKWVSKMRSEFKKRENGQQSSLTVERIAELNNLGFEWVLGRGHRSSNLPIWKLRLEELREFHQIHGHCRVPQRYPQNPSLGKWVSKMRSEFQKRENGKESSLTDGRIATLNNLGFDWVVYEAWEIRLQKLREFRQTNGHCRVPQKYPQNPSLGHWVASMRRRKSSLTVERIAALNNLGFDWVVNEAREIRLEELRFAERGLKRVRLCGVATASQPIKKRRFTEIQEMQ